MNDKRKADQVSQVQDKPTEVWIKSLFFITAIAVGMIAYMGDRFIKGQDKIAAGQIEMTKEISKLNSYFKVIDSRVSRNINDIIGIKGDIKGVNVKVNENSKWIYELRGNHNGK